MRVFLTGATGFIGSHLARVLVREDLEVFALLRPESDPWRIQDILSDLNVIHGDLLSSTSELEEKIKEIRPNTCFHFAWYTEPGVFLGSDLNFKYLSASLELATHLEAAGCQKLVVTGTFSEYDQEFGYLSEDTPTRPDTLYAAAKIALYLTLSEWQKQAGMKLLWPRIFSVYGPAEHERRFIPAVILALLRGEATRLSPGEQQRDFLHVEDVAEAIWAITKAGLTGPVNIGSGNPVPIGKLAMRIGELLDRVDLVRLGDLPYRETDPMFICANNQRLLRKTGWRLRYSMEQGLRNTIEWWREHLKSN